ncbi:Cj0814 family flagellar-dependent secreted protein [Campylobacter sp. VTCC 70190]|uniref:Cj0814 family flagellar-dependent secreted protein n=1 Tax=Campylobacter sp. VTCC 70190 TaxID=3392118 RepID=UPI00398E51E8
MSIFSINDNSNYTSILSQSKANKESKEKSKISFANAFLKQNASKLNEIQSANSQTLARSEVLNSTNTTNTSNNTNLSINNTTQTTSPNYNISSEFKNSIYALKYKQADISTTTNTAYGYSVNKDGYMGSDFNKAAGLPEDFKIHKSTLDEIKKTAENRPDVLYDKQYFGVSEYYTNIDMAETIKQYYNLFSNALNQSFPSDKNSFSEKDINSMPKGYAMNGFYNGDGIFKHPNPVRNDSMRVKHLANFSDAFISNVYKTQEQFDEANNIDFDSGGLITGIKPQTFGLSLEEIKNVSQAKYECDFKPDMSVYPQNEDGSYSKEALFMSFLKSQEGRPVESLKTTLNPTIEAHNRAMAKESFSGPAINIDSIMTGKSDFKSFFRYWAERGIAGGQLYMYDKGITPRQALGNWALDAEIKQALANGWKASSESINSYADSIMDRLNKLIGQTRV